MFKKRYLSVQSDFKTGIFYKISFLLGILLLIISIFLIGSSFLLGEGNSGILQQIYYFSQTKIPNSETTYPNLILAFSIILLAVGVILYFFYCQFAKLAKIADEIEKGEEIEDLPENNN
jgi:hypothetical protein